MRRALGLCLAAALLIVAAAQLETLPEWAVRLPEAFERTFLGVAAWQWIGLGAILVIALVAALVSRSLAWRLTVFRDRYAPHPMAALTRRTISRAAGGLVGSLLAVALLPDLRLRAGFERDVTLLCHIVAVFSGVLYGYGWWDAVCDTLATRAAGHQRAERLLVPMMRKLVRALIIAGGVLLAIGVFGGTKAITSLIATLGLSGLVIALAAKDSVENLFGSLTILFDMPFALGDWVRISPVEGEVEQINLRSTRIRTAEDTVVTLPNANLIRASVENFGARRFRRQKLLLRLSYDCRPEAIQSYSDALRTWIDAQPSVRPEQTIVELHDPQEGSIGLLVQFQLEVNSYREETRVRNDVLEQALGLRKPHGVVFSAGPRPPDPVKT